MFSRVGFIFLAIGNGLSYVGIPWIDDFPLWNPFYRKDLILFLLIKFFLHPEAHFEMAIRSSSENLEYYQKDSLFLEFGQKERLDVGELPLWDLMKSFSKMDKVFLSIQGEFENGLFP